MTAYDFPHRPLMRLAGLATWLVVASPTLVALASEPGRLGDARWLGWAGAFILFGAAYWCGLSISAKWPPAVALLLLAVQSLAGLGMVYGEPEWAGALLVVVAAQLPLWLPLPASLGWMLAQTLALGWIYGSSLSVAETLTRTVAYLMFQMFASFVSNMARNEARAREELDRVNAELRATRELLTESSRLAERARISRDLHDVLGHHLTALCLNLEVMSLSGDGMEQQVEKAQAVAKLLLADVRGVVSGLREEQTFDLTRALRALVEDLPHPHIHLAMPESLGIEEASRAHALLRCLQEIVTNTLRHAGAGNLWLDIDVKENAVEIRARDDGRGVEVLRPGRGLTGMRERLALVGGSLEIESGPGRGFQLRVRMPLSGVVS